VNNAKHTPLYVTGYSNTMHK